MGFTEGMSMFLGVIAILAVAFNIWLSTKWGKKWLNSLD